MSSHMAQQSKLVSKFKNLQHSFIKTLSHLDYLSKCKGRDVIPKSLNLGVLLKGQIWDENSESIYLIVKDASEKLLDTQVIRWHKKKVVLENEINKVENEQRNILSDTDMLRVLNNNEKVAEKILKRLKEAKTKKLERDKGITEELEKRHTKKHKKQNRRFRRKKVGNQAGPSPSTGGQEDPQLMAGSTVDPSPLAGGSEIGQQRFTGKVKNLSTEPLDKGEQESLELGQNFCPVVKDIDRSKFQKDLKAGFRRMKICDFFHPDEDVRTEEEKRFYTPSPDWEPPAWRVNKSPLKHNQIIQHKFDQWKQPVRVKDNLSKECRDAIKSLKRKDISLDDKSGSFVVSDKNTYIEAALNDLVKQNNIAEVTANSETDKEVIIQEIENKISEVEWMIC